MRSVLSWVGVSIPVAQVPILVQDLFCCTDARLASPSPPAMPPLQGQRRVLSVCVTTRCLMLFAQVLGCTSLALSNACAVLCGRACPAHW
jgi:hypothetical protein